MNPRDERMNKSGSAKKRNEEMKLSLNNRGQPNFQSMANMEKTNNSFMDPFSVASPTQNDPFSSPQRHTENFSNQVTQSMSNIEDDSMAET